MSNTWRRRDVEEECGGHRPSGVVYDGPFVLSTHAVARFRERVAGGLSHARARAELLILSKTARKLDERTPKGDEFWEARDGAPIRFIVKVDAVHHVRICTTVLAPDERQSEPQLMREAV